MTTIKEIVENLPVPTWTTAKELAYLCEATRGYELGVELGTFHGMSAWCLLKANPKLHLWCVDHWQAYAFNREVAAHFLKDFIKEGRCELITGDSTVASAMLQHTKGKLGFCWVDDGHEEWQVKRDIESFWPLLQTGGKLIGHDFEHPHNDVARGVIASGIKFILPPVGRLWESLKV